MLRVNIFSLCFYYCVFYFIFFTCYIWDRHDQGEGKVPLVQRQRVPHPQRGLTDKQSLGVSRCVPECPAPNTKSHQCTDV